ncbi:MAG: DUF4175 family protein [Saprospiraceae bacterium]
MNNLNNNYNILIEKLDNFIRKYYLSKIIKGSIIFLSIVLALFLVFNLMEDQFYFNKITRKILFFGFIFISLSFLVYSVLIPLFKYFRLGKTISKENAALIIGAHFQTVKDKLLNILQLHNLSQSSVDNELLLASIDQKSEEIKLVPFKSAVNLNANRKYLKYLLPLVFILLLILAINPGIISSSTERIIKNNIDYKKPAPFSFDIKNKKMEAVQFSDFDLLVTTEGDAVPNEIYVDIDNFQYRMVKLGSNEFKYTFKNIQKDIDFKLFSGKIESEDYNINMIPKPLITDFSVYVDYPSYTGQKDELIRNTGDLMILEGSVLKWNFDSQNTDDIKMSFGLGKNDNFNLDIDNDKSYFSKQIKDDQIYKVFIKNNKIENPDSMSFSINVIKDKFPTIVVDQMRDSLNDNQIYFVGDIADDYGFSSLNFKYSVKDDGNTQGQEFSKKIDFDKDKNFRFRYFIDFNELGIKPGQTIKYWFEVKDNDGINGPKKAVTNEQEYRSMSEDEFDQKENENEEDIKDNLEKIFEQSKKIQDKLQKLREKMLQKKEPDWQDKKELEKLLEQEKDLQKMLEEAKKKMDENLQKQQEYKKIDESILKKQEQLQKMFDESLSQEQKDLMDKIQELMEELQKDQMLDEMENMSMDQSKMEKQMDRMLELFKQLELEKEMNEVIDKLNDLADKQQQLSQDTKDKKESNEELSEKQKELNEEFEKTKEKLDELEKKNEDLEHPKNLADDNKEKMEDIEKDMDKSNDQLKDQKNSGASESQKGAAQKMKSMAESLEMQMNGSSQEQHEEDLKALRQILENILTLSFSQEKLMGNTEGVIVNSPAFKKVLLDQNKIKDDFKIVEDSLQALSKRVIEIQSFVNDKVADVKSAMNGSIEYLTNDDKLPGTRDFPNAIKSQHESMKGLNDLALMLDEAMQQMQSNSSGMPGNGSCNKPGGSGKNPGKSGSEPMDKIAKGQQGLTEKMKKMLSEMKGKSGSGGMPKEFAEAAKNQAELRKALEALQRQQQEEGKGANGDLQKMIDEMNKVEEDLVNKKLDAKLIQRQQDITTRLLEADKAQRQRGFDAQRKSTTGQDIDKKMPPSIEKFMREKEAQIDTYKSSPPALKPFYRELVREYIENVKK